MRGTRNDKTVSSSGLRALGSERLKFEKSRYQRFVGTHLGSLYVSVKLPTYPTLKPTLTLTSHLGQNVGFEERAGGQIFDLN